MDMNVLIGVSVAVVLLLSAWPLARFYDDSRSSRWSRSSRSVR